MTPLGTVGGSVSITAKVPIPVCWIEDVVPGDVLLELKSPGLSTVAVTRVTAITVAITAEITTFLEVDILIDSQGIVSCQILLETEQLNKLFSIVSGVFYT